MGLYSSNKPLNSSTLLMCLPPIIAVFICWLWPNLSSGASIGFCYGRNGHNLPSPSATSRLLLASSVTKVRIYDYNTSVLTAFAHTGIDVMLTIPNEELTLFNSETFAHAWVDSTLVPLVMLDSVRVSAISVGVEVLTTMPHLSDYLLPAIMSVHTGLVKANLSDRIMVTTTHSMGVLDTTYPPSRACFKNTIGNTYMKPIVDYLKAIRSFYMVNAYPYHAYIADSKDIALDFALFQPKDLVVDPATGLSYSSLLAAQLDAVYFALEGMGHADIGVIVSETGWPTKGDHVDEKVANVQNAATYNNNLLMLVQNNTGTPYRPTRPIDAYIFSVFDEDKKVGKESERHWGVFNVDGTNIYYLDIDRSESGTQQSFNGTRPTWCVASPYASSESLLRGLNYACGDCNADCEPIQAGQPCYFPNTYLNHASYAYNSYYQRSGNNNAACNFNGSAMITMTDPSYGSCKFPFDALYPSTNVYGSSTKCNYNVVKVFTCIIALLTSTLL